MRLFGAAGESIEGAVPHAAVEQQVLARDDDQVPAAEMTRAVADLLRREFLGALPPVPV